MGENTVHSLVLTVMGSSPASSSASLVIILLFFAFSSSFATAADTSPSLSSTASSVSSSSALNVLVPWKVGFDQFVSVSENGTLLDGFSVQVFLQALRRVKSPPQIHFLLQGNGKETPSYDDMVQKVANGEADAIVADLTITRERMKSVDFTMPYAESALVMVTTFKYGSAGALWDFLRPFSWQLWVVLLSSFAATGVALYLLENNNPDFSSTNKHPGPAAPVHVPSAMTDPSLQQPPAAPGPGPAAQYTPPEADSASLQPTNPFDPSSLQRFGPPIFDKASHKRRFMNAYWFTSLCIFSAQQESVRTHLGRIVTVTWLFVMHIFNSSYTASLASLLSAQQSYPTIEGLDALLKSDIAVGYQEGSFMKGFLTTKMGFQLKRLKSYASEQDYTEALKKGPQNGGVGAVLDELPYTQILLQSECNSFTTVGNQRAYFGGFGFGFSKNSTLTDEISKGILSLAEDGVLENLKNGWLGGDSTGGQCSSADEPSHLRLRSFGGLFSILGSVYCICIAWRFLAKVRKGRCSHAVEGRRSDTKRTGEMGLRSFSSRRRSNRITVDDDDGSHSAGHGDRIEKKGEIGLGSLGRRRSNSVTADDDDDDGSRSTGHGDHITIP